MASPTHRRFQVLLATLLGLGAAACAGLAWRHRVELFVIPHLWRQVRELAALREAEPEHIGFQPTENRGLTPFDWTLSRLIRLQRPDFKGGKGFEIRELEREDGGRAYLLAYEPLEVPFDAPVDPEAIEIEIVSFYGDGCSPATLLALDAAGRPLGQPLGVRLAEPFGQGEALSIAGARRSTPVVRLTGRTGCRSCLDGSWMASRLLAVDRRGIVDLGFATHRWHGLDAPVCSASGWQEKVDAATVSELLASGSLADLHRALSRLWWDSEASVLPVLALLGHEEPFIRSRTAAIAGRVASLAPAILPLLRDPDPRVRFAAIEAARSSPGWGQLVGPLVSDANPVVARRALREIVLATHREVDRRAPDADTPLLGELGGTALARKLMVWLEAEAGGAHGQALAWQISTFSRAQLLPATSDLLRVSHLCRAAGDWALLARALARLDVPEADAYLMNSLCGESPGTHCACTAILRALWARETPIRAAALQPRLLPFIAPRGPCPGGESWWSQRAAAFLLARHGSLEGLSWLLTRSWSWEDSTWPYESLAFWVDFAWAEEQADCRR